MWQNRGRTGYSIVGTRLEPPEHVYSLHGAFMVLTMHYASAYCTHKVPNNYLIDTQPAMHRPGGRRAALASPGCGRYVPRPIAAVIWQTGLHKGAACKNHLNATTAQRETIFMSNPPCSAARGSKGGSCPRASSSSWIGLGDTHTRALGAGLSCFAL
jgi:hypothetical protein